MTIEQIPERFGWILTHLIRLGENEWQANLSNEEAVVVGVGFDLTSAVWDALDKSEDETNHKPKFRLNFYSQEIKPSLAALGLIRERQLVRRF